MALINIIKGMADGAEAIQANFAEIGLAVKGSNANGDYIRFPSGFTIAWKELTYTDASGWTTGKYTTFDIGTLPIAFIGDYHTSVEAYFYDGAGGFQDFKLSVGKVYPHVGTVFVDKGSSMAKTITVQAIIIGMS